jgi:hypothetical protein
VQWHIPVVELLGKLRQENHLSPGTQGQPGQHNETLSQTNKQTKTGQGVYLSSRALALHICSLGLNPQNYFQKESKKKVGQDCSHL